MTLIITTHTNHSLGGAQCSSHTTGTIFRQAAASGFLFNASSQIFSERDSIYCREILACFFFKEAGKDMRVLIRLMMRAYFRWLAGSQMQPWDNPSRCTVESVFLRRCWHFYIPFSRDASAAVRVLVWNRRQESSAIDGLQFQHYFGSCNNPLSFPAK